MQTVREYFAPPRTCSYLPNEQASFHYLLIDDCETITYQHILERGFRRFGKVFFRHNCSQCQKCQSIRIPLDTFKASKSQRRVFNRNSNIELKITRPQVSDEHINLYNQFHSQRTIDRSWKSEMISPDEYLENFVEGFQEFGWEFQYRCNKELVGIGLVDEVYDSFSSVYFYYSPTWAKDSPGTFSILKEIEFAKAAGKKYLNLGYWVKDNQSLNYKANFKPHELLSERTPFDQNPNWKPQKDVYES